MSKGLEYIQKVINVQKMRIEYYKDVGTDTTIHEGELTHLKQVEQELKEGQLWKQKYDMLEKLHINLIAENGATKKILEIIKEKQANITILIGCDSLEEYNKHPLSWKHLTQEEYDLLKEVLI